MASKRNFLILGGVLLLAFSFWLGRLTGHVDSKGDGAMHHDSPATAKKPAADATPHTDAPGTAPHAHEEKRSEAKTGKEQEGAGLKAKFRGKAEYRIENSYCRPEAYRARRQSCRSCPASPDREAQVSSRVSGKVAGLFFKVGDMVQKGQRLADIQSAEMQKTQVELLQAENKLTLAKAELDRIQALVESKIALERN